MNQKPIVLGVFWSFAGLTLVLWILRGLRILTGVSSGVLWLLIFLSITFGVLYRLQTPRRY
ncbi:hypothetical protein NG796_16435 [Laspinema sp. A4]|nr:hypothetical protein [Laspinema sp. D2d]